MTRPAVPHLAPTGLRWEAVEDGGRWRIAEVSRPCRHGAGPRVSSCRQPSVLELNRGLRTPGRPRADCWWAYCAEHSYGRWIENGRVLCWRLVASQGVDGRVSIEIDPLQVDTSEPEVAS